MIEQTFFLSCDTEQVYTINSEPIAHLIRFNAWLDHEVAHTNLVLLELSIVVPLAAQSARQVIIRLLVVLHRLNFLDTSEIVWVIGYNNYLLCCFCRLLLTSRKVVNLGYFIVPHRRCTASVRIWICIKKALMLDWLLLGKLLCNWSTFLL